jgi:hypothetical protein
MKVFRRSAFLALMAALFLIGFSGCKSPEPVWQSKPVNFGGVKTMTVYYMALPKTTPTWWDNLKIALESIASDFGPGNYVLTVIPGSTAGFDVPNPGDKKATVGELFLPGKGSGVIGLAINSATIDKWIQ